MVKCLLCQRVYNKAFDVSFHRFPSDQATRKLWCKITDHTVIAQTDRLCSQHFTDDCFQVHKELGQRLLKPYSVPTLALAKLEAVKKDCILMSSSVLTEHNYVARPGEFEKPKVNLEPPKIFIKYPYVLNTRPTNITPKLVVPDVKFNIPLTYQPVMTNISQPLRGNMMYAVKINPVNKMEALKAPVIVQSSGISKKEDALAKRKLASSKHSRDSRKEENKQNELTLKKLQTVSKKVVDQRQTIKMLRQKLRRLEARFDMQKNLIKHLNSKLGETTKERKIKIELQSE